MKEMNEYINKVYFKSSKKMAEIPNNSIDLIVTSPPYYNIKDYAKDGLQKVSHSTKAFDDIGAKNNFEEYINELSMVWIESERVLKPNGKLCINTPLMPMIKKNFNSHYNRHIYDIQSEIQYSILRKTGLFLLDIYIWNRINSTKKLMFGSYPYPNNFYAQNTIEFIAVYVKDGKPNKKYTPQIKAKSKLTQQEWIEFTKQIWNIPIPNKSDKAFGKHSAIMPEEIVNRCVRLFSFENDIILDPFAGSGTTLKVAKQLKRNFVGYEIYSNYEKIINDKIYGK
jgi:site-specific DNA-methyltransferase (cytosine-N4-specific)